MLITPVDAFIHILAPAEHVPELSLVNCALRSSCLLMPRSRSFLIPLLPSMLHQCCHFSIALFTLAVFHGRACSVRFLIPLLQCSSRNIYSYFGSCRARRSSAVACIIYALRPACFSLPCVQSHLFLSAAAVLVTSAQSQLSDSVPAEHVVSIFFLQTSMVSHYLC